MGKGSPAATLGLLVLAVLHAPDAAGRDRIDYLQHFDAEYVGKVIESKHLHRWRERGFDLAPAFRAARGAFQARLATRLAQKHQRAMSRLPEPALNRMALTVLREKGGLLGSLGEEVAFIGKFIADDKRVEWVPISSSNDIPATEVDLAMADAAKGPPYDLGRVYKMNCQQFIIYAAFLAGLPRDETNRLPAGHLAPLGKDAVLIDPAYFHKDIVAGIGPIYRGYWVPVYDRNTSQPIRFERVPAMVPGDLIVINKILEHHVGGVWGGKTPEFYHVEMVLRSGSNRKKTESVGNVGDMPRHKDDVLAEDEKPSWLASAVQTVGADTRDAGTQFVIWEFKERAIPPVLML